MYSLPSASQMWLPWPRTITVGRSRRPPSVNSCICVKCSQTFSAMARRIAAGSGSGGAPALRPRGRSGRSPPPAPGAVSSVIAGGGGGAGFMLLRRRVFLRDAGHLCLPLSRQPDRHVQARRDVAAPDREHVLDDDRRDVDAGRLDAVAELHRVVDFVDEQAAIADPRRDRCATTPPPTGLRRARADVGEFRRDRAVARRLPPRAVLVIQCGESR